MVTRCTAMAVLTGLLVGHAFAAEQDPTNQIRAMQEERVGVLNKLVVVYDSLFRVGTTWTEAVISAEMDCLGARLGVAENREARIALLTKALKKYEETQKSVEHSDAPLSEADVLWWRALYLHAKLSLLGEQNDGADHVKLVQKEWIAALTKVAGHHELSYKVGTIDCEAFVLADVALVHAQFEAAGDREQRITVLTEAVKRETKFLDVAQDRFSKNSVGQDDVDRAKSLLLATKIRLLRERGTAEDPAAQVRQLQKERVETLAKVVDAYESRYRTGTIDCESVVAAMSDLVDARLDGTAKPADRITALTAEVNKQGEFLKIADGKFNANKVSENHVLLVRALLLKTKIKLLREESTQKAQPKVDRPSKGKIVPRQG